MILKLVDQKALNMVNKSKTYDMLKIVVNREISKIDSSNTVNIVGVSEFGLKLTINEEPVLIRYSLINNENVAKEVQSIFKQIIEKQIKEGINNA